MRSPTNVPPGEAPVATPTTPVDGVSACDTPSPAERSRTRSVSLELRTALIVGTLCVASLTLLQLSRLTYVDPDIWHEMALAREALRLGAMPLADSFAYTPTVYPMVHHEWGTGAVLYAVTAAAGGAGLMLLKYALVVVTAGFCVAEARLRGAKSTTILSLAPLAVLLTAIGLTTVRAQLFTLAALAIQLYLLERDRQGDRRWIWLWLPLYVVWLNLHAGFVVGVALFGCYLIEQACRRRPVGHLMAVGVAMVLLVAATPYGRHYYPYLVHGVLLDRPLISEWAPLWQTGGSTLVLYAASLMLLIYTVCVAGPRRLVGLLLVAVAAYAALRHTRHVSLYGVVWFAYMPSFIDSTPLGASLANIWRGRARIMASGAALVAVVCVVQSIPGRPWQAILPANADALAAGQPTYPIGAVDYLAEQKFHGNVMVPFVEGGYVLWKLTPAAKVSIDGRYELCYQPGVLEENAAFYQALPGWQSTLTKYPTDIVLVPRCAPLAEKLPGEPGWHRVYQDDLYELYARAGMTLPPRDRQGEVLLGKIP